MTEKTTCTTPPDGFSCSRPAGHTGPCAATQDTPAALSAPTKITIDFKMATDLLEMFGGEPCTVTLQIGGEGCHSGTGVYAFYEELQEEGSHFLGVPDDEAVPQAATSAAGGATGDLAQLFCEAMAWGAVYHPIIATAQWDELRDGMAAQFVSRAALAAQSPDSGAGPITMPEGWVAVKKERLDRMRAASANPSVPCYQGRNLYDEQKVHANWDACRGALATIEEELQSILEWKLDEEDWDEARAALAQQGAQNG